MGKKKGAGEQNHPLVKISLQVLGPRNRTAGQQLVQRSALDGHSLASDFSCSRDLVVGRTSLFFMHCCLAFGSFMYDRSRFATLTGQADATLCLLALISLFVSHESIQDKLLPRRNTIICHLYFILGSLDTRVLEPVTPPIQIPPQAGSPVCSASYQCVTIIRHLFSSHHSTLAWRQRPFLCNARGERKTRLDSRIRSPISVLYGLVIRPCP